mgnify:CR=1 FL=1
MEKAAPLPKFKKNQKKFSPLNPCYKQLQKRVETLTVKHPIMRDIEVSTF